MRGREFIMKDAYSFDRDQVVRQRPATRSWPRPTGKIFDRFGLTYRAVAADSGAIGGDLSEEFQVIAATGEDAIVYCPGSDYAANMEKAEALAAAGSRVLRQPSAMHEGRHTGQEHLRRRGRTAGLPLAAHGQIAGARHRRKTTTRATSSRSTVWLLLLRGDHDMNEVKVGKLPGMERGFRFATSAEIDEHFGCKPGYLGPVGPEEAVACGG